MRLGGRESGGWLELGPAPPPTQAAWQVHTVTVRRRRYPLADRRLTGPWFVPAHETGALGHTNARSRSNLDSAPPSGERRAAQMDGASFLCGLPPVVRSISQTRPCGAVSPASWNWRRPRRLPSRANHVAATRPPQRGFAEKGVMDRLVKKRFSAQPPSLSEPTRFNRVTRCRRRNLQKGASRFCWSRFELVLAVRRTPPLARTNPFGRLRAAGVVPHWLATL